MSNELPIETATKAPFQPFVGEIKMRRIPTLNALCVIYGEMTKEESERIKKGIEEARLFMWRNSRCRMNLNITFAYGDNTPNLDSDELKEIEKDLRKRGYDDDQFAFVFIALPEIKEIKGGYRILGNTAAGTGWKSIVPYPGEDISVEYKIVWAFTKTFCESLDVILKNNDLSPVFKGNFDDGFRSAAKGLAALDGIEKLKAPNNSYIEVFDADDDGIPDADDRVPLDEARFPSDSRYKDTDNDYLDDMDELTASIWRSTSNLDRDTDKDKLVDGKDPFPFLDFQPAISAVKFVPSIDGKIENTWKVLSKGCFWSASENPNITIYTGWDDANLYIAAKSDKKLNITLKIKDNEKSSKTRDYLLTWEGKEVLLHDWTKIKDGGKSLPVKTGSLAHWIGDDGTFQTEASIPVGKEAFKLEKGKKILIQLYLTNPEDIKDNIWVTEFDGFYEVMLEK